eukprot:Rhum_TRINITY_DN11070_c0_g2::Rhum_TRINITY_DN11070_c0_g2_i1::g.42195::m.42195
MLCASPMSWPRLAGRRILVLGMGGGCDVFAAYAVAKMLEEEAAGDGGAPAAVAYGACTGPRPMGPDAVDVGGRGELFRFAGASATPLEPGARGYGQVLLERSVPRCARTGSPLVVVVGKGGGEGDTVASVTAANGAVLRRAVEEAGAELVVGVDCGGDSLTGGVDWKTSPDLGRDTQVLRGLGSCGVTFLHVVLGPGCDGESTAEQLGAAGESLREKGCFVGAFPVARVASAMRALSEQLAENRTPNIMHAAWRGGLPEREDGSCEVARHGLTQWIPREFLLSAWVFDHSRGGGVALQSTL